MRLNQKKNRAIEYLSNFLGKPLLLFIFLSISTFALAQENCSNGIDDDGDGLIDLNDTADCFCEGTSGGEIESIIPNPSFEENSCCPSSFSELFCADDWVQASDATSDYFNTCDFVIAPAPLPFPDGEGIVGGYIITDFFTEDVNYFEYVGACLDATMPQGEDYTLQFQIAGVHTDLQLVETLPVDAGPIEITLYGFGACGTLPIPGQDCPVSEGWYEMGTVTYQPDNQWSIVTITFIPPEDTDAIMLGAPCDVNSEGYDNLDGQGGVMYFMYDDLILNESSLFSGIINQTGGNCIGDLVLSTANSSVFSYQWYYEGVAILGQTTSSLNLGPEGYDEGIYQVLVTNSEDGTCTIVETEVSASVNSPLDFSADVLSGCSPLEVNFTDLTDPAFVESVIWDFGSGFSDEPAPTFTFTEPGFYDITLNVITPAGCETSFTIPNYIQVFASEIPDISFQILDECAPYRVIFTSDQGESANCLWDFGALGTSNECETIEIFDLEGTYSVSLSVDGTSGCSEEGTIDVNVIAGDPPDFQFIAPNGICTGQTEIIDTEFEDGQMAWLGGPNGSSLEITEPGVYYATFTRDDGCTKTDSILIQENFLPELSASDKEACEGDQVQLFASANQGDIRWPDISNSNVAMVDSAGIYIVEAENDCGIVQLEVQVFLNDCSCDIYIPNAFTPNGDGINDVFKPSINCELQFYEFLIYDRWGGQVFNSTDPIESWGGEGRESSDFAGNSQVYQYILRYDNGLRTNNNIEEVRGFVTLAR